MYRVRSQSLHPSEPTLDEAQGLFGSSVQLVTVRIRATARARLGLACYRLR